MLNRFLTPADKWRLGIIALAGLIFAIAWPLTAVTVEWASFNTAFFFTGLMTAAGLAYRGLNRDKGIAAVYFVMAQMILFAIFANLDNYLGFVLHRPLQDEYLAGIDRALGLDWWSYVIWIKSNPFAGRVLYFAYQSSQLQLVAAILLLGITHRFARLDRLTLAFMIAGSLTIAFWVLFPSFGALPLRYALGLPDPGFTLAMSKKVAMQQLALHAGPLPPLRFEDLTGYVGFPSFHTVVAILTIQALWRLPVSGPLALAANILILLAIPADGGHHFVDMAGGVLVVLLSLALATAILRQAGAEPKKVSTLVTN